MARPQAGKLKIFEAALQLFCEQGFFVTSIEQITGKAGVSKGLVYNYFKSKDQLLLALIEHYTQKMQDVAEKSLQAKDWNDFLAHFFHFLQAEKPFLTMQLKISLQPSLKPILGDHIKQRAAHLFQSVFNRLPEGPKRDEKTYQILALLDGVALHYLTIFENYPLDKLKTELIQTIQNIAEDNHAI